MVTPFIMERIRSGLTHRSLIGNSFRLLIKLSSQVSTSDPIHCSFECEEPEDLCLIGRGILANLSDGQLI